MEEFYITVEQGLAIFGVIMLVIVLTIISVAHKPLDSEYKDLDKKFPRK